VGNFTAKKTKYETTSTFSISTSVEEGSICHTILNSVFQIIEPGKKSNETALTNKELFYYEPVTENDFYSSTCQWKVKLLVGMKRMGER